MSSITAAHDIIARIIVFKVHVRGVGMYFKVGVL